MSQPGHHQLELFPLGRIHQRVLSQFWLGFAGPWDILKQKQAVCLWGQSCEGLGWCHFARLSHRISTSQRRDQLFVASEQRHPGDIFQGSPGGRSCYDVFWNHTGFCLLSHTWVRYPGFSGHVVKCPILTTVVPGFPAIWLAVPFGANGAHLGICTLSEKIFFFVWNNLFLGVIKFSQRRTHPVKSLWWQIVPMQESTNEWKN